MSNINQQENLYRYIQSIAAKLDGAKTYSDVMTGTVEESYPSYYKIRLSNGSSHSLYTAYSFGSVEYSKNDFVYLIEGRANNGESISTSYYIIGLVEEVQEDFVNLSNLERFIRRGFSQEISLKKNADDSYTAVISDTNDIADIKQYKALKISGSITYTAAKDIYNEYGIIIESRDKDNKILETLYFTSADFRGQPQKLIGAKQEKVIIFTSQIEEIKSIKFFLLGKISPANIKDIRIECGELIDIKSNISFSITAENNKDYFTATETKTTLRARAAYNGKGVFSEDMQYYWFIYDEKEGSDDYHYNAYFRDENPESDEYDEKRQAIERREIRQLAPRDSEGRWLCIQSYDLVGINIKDDGITSVPLWHTKNKSLIDIYSVVEDQPQFFDQYRNRVKCILKYHDDIVESNVLEIYNYTKEEYSVSISADTNPAVLLDAGDQIVLSAVIANNNKYVAPTTEIFYSWQKETALNSNEWTDVKVLVTKGLSNTIWEFGTVLTTPVPAGLAQFPDLKYKVVSDSNYGKFDDAPERIGIYFGYTKVNNGLAELTVIPTENFIMDGQGQRIPLGYQEAPEAGYEAQYLKILDCPANDENHLLEILLSLDGEKVEGDLEGGTETASKSTLVVQDRGVSQIDIYEMKDKTEKYRCIVEIQRNGETVSKEISTNTVIVESFVDNTQRETVSTTYYQYGTWSSSAVVFKEKAPSLSNGFHARYIKTKDKYINPQTKYYIQLSTDPEQYTAVDPNELSEENLGSYYVEYQYLTDWVYQYYEYTQIDSDSYTNSTSGVQHLYEYKNEGYYYIKSVQPGQTITIPEGTVYYMGDYQLDNDAQSLTYLKDTDQTDLINQQGFLALTDHESIESFILQHGDLPSNGVLFYSKQTITEEKITIDGANDTAIYRTLRVEDWSKPIISAQFQDGRVIVGPIVDKINTFNDLTASGSLQGLFVAPDGDVYLNATHIRSGRLEIHDQTGNNVKFLADIDSSDVQIAGFNVNESSIYKLGTTGGQLGQSIMDRSTVYLGEDGLKLGPWRAPYLHVYSTTTNNNGSPVTTWQAKFRGDIDVLSTYGGNALGNKLVFSVDSKKNQIVLDANKGTLYLEGKTLAINSDSLKLNYNDNQIQTGGYFELSTKNFKVNNDGIITADGGSIAGWSFDQNNFYKQAKNENSYDNYYSGLSVGETESYVCQSLVSSGTSPIRFYAGLPLTEEENFSPTTDADGSEVIKEKYFDNAKFKVLEDGSVYLGAVQILSELKQKEEGKKASSIEISDGKIIANGGSYGIGKIIIGQDFNISDRERVPLPNILKGTSGGNLEGKATGGISYDVELNKDNLYLSKSGQIYGNSSMQQSSLQLKLSSMKENGIDEYGQRQWSGGLLFQRKEYAQDLLESYLMFQDACVVLQASGRSAGKNQTVQFQINEEGLYFIDTEGEEYEIVLTPSGWTEGLKYADIKDTNGVKVIGLEPSAGYKGSLKIPALVPLEDTNDSTNNRVGKLVLEIQNESKTKAFSKDIQINTVKLPVSIQTIGSSVFTNHSELQKIIFFTTEDIDVKLKSIEAGCFSGCSKLYSITVPSGASVLNSLSNIGESAFSGCSSLGSAKPLISSSSLSTIGNSAFLGCSSLTSITLNGKSLTIGDNAFSGCSYLSSIMINGSLLEIGEDAFSECSNLSSITINGSVNIKLLQECASSLEQLSITKNADFISKSLEDEGKFEQENNLSIIFEGTVTDWCLPPSQEKPFSPSNLWKRLSPSKKKSIELTLKDTLNSEKGILSWPKGASTIPSQAFAYCSNLKVINRYFSGEGEVVLTSIETGAFYKCNNLENVTIPESVNTIAASAFKECENLKNVTLPKSLTRFHWGFFDGCTSLTTIYFEGSLNEWNILIGNTGEIGYPSATNGCSVRTSDNGLAYYPPKK